MHAWLDKLMEKFYAKALEGDVNSATLCVKAWERKSALLGLDAVQRVDLQIIRPGLRARSCILDGEAVACDDNGGSPDWLKMKNADAPAVKRGAEEDWGREKWR